MKFISIKGESSPVSFREAMLRGIAPDGSLYIPSQIPKLPPLFLEETEDVTIQHIAEVVTSSFIDQIPEKDLRAIVEDAFNFPIPLVTLENDVYLLELFHGPTFAFKDVGARFMAKSLSYFLQFEQTQLTILVATSGDTGSAVANGFYNAQNIEVFILYPSGKISRLQEQQMTTLGGNIQAFEIEGTFDDCQRLLKQALGDSQIQSVRTLTTANSINLGRLLPQIVYYVWAIVQWKQFDFAGEPLVVVPSGNFGNLTAAAYAKAMGTPIRGFIAATNANDVVPSYFRSGKFSPRPSIQTLSNAMDVGNPSNLARVQALYNNEMKRMRQEISALSISDDETLKEIRQTYERTGYILDPHTAVGVAAARKMQQQSSSSHPLIVAATAHPAKFPEVIKKAIGIDIPLPPPLSQALNKTKLSTLMPAEFSVLKEKLMR